MISHQHGNSQLVRQGRGLSTTRKADMQLISSIIAEKSNLFTEVSSVAGSRGLFCKKVRIFGRNWGWRVDFMRRRRWVGGGGKGIRENALDGDDGVYKQF